MDNLKIYKEETMMKTDLGKFFVMAIIGISMIFLFPGNSPAAETIKLGVAGPHSGDLASYGLPTVNAAELVVKISMQKAACSGKK